MSIEKNDTHAQRAHIEALIKILEGMYDLDCIGKINANTADWIMQDIEYVEMGYLKQAPDSDYQYSVLEENDGSLDITYKQAVELLGIRVSNSINYIIFTENEEQ